MFRKRKDKIEEELDRLYRVIDTMDPLYEDYKIVQERIIELEKVRTERLTADSRKSSDRVSVFNTILGGVFSIGGVFMVTKAEELRILSSKALSFVKKLK